MELRTLLDMLALALSLAFFTSVQAPVGEPRTLVDCKEPIAHAAVDPDGKVLVVANADGDLRALDIASGKERWKLPAPTDLGAPGLAQIRALAVGESSIVIAREFPIPFAVDLAKGTPLPDFMAVAMMGPAPLNPRAIALDPGETWFWVAYLEGVLMRHAPKSPKAYSRRGIEGMRLASVATEGKLVAVGCEDGSIRFADVSNADVDEKKVFQGPSSPVTALAFAGRANALVSGAKDGSLRVWNVANGKAKHEISAGKEAIVAVAIHPKAKWFATGNLFGDVRVWSLDKGTQLAEFAAGSELALRGLFVLDGGKTLGVSRGGPAVIAYDVSKL